MIRFPNYDKSILSISASVLKYYGVEDCPHHTLKEFDEILKKDYENVIVILFDGMGVGALNTHLDRDSFLRKHLVCPISSVFPSTTTAATTSILSGYSPVDTVGLGGICILKNLMKMLLCLKILCKKTEKKPRIIMLLKGISFVKIFFNE